MSVYPNGLVAHLDRRVTTLCHCWRLTRMDGTVLGFTDHDRRLSADGTLFEPEAGFTASEARDTLGLAVDTIDVEGALSSAVIRDDDIAAGVYDGATIDTLLVNWRKSADFVLLRRATIGKITRSDGRFIAELESLVQSLDRPNGRYVRRGCDAELGDDRCGFSLETPDFSGVGTVVSVSDIGTVVVSGLEGFAPGWLSSGRLIWQSGANVGRMCRIADHGSDSGEISLILWPGQGFPPQPGDGFIAHAGCDKRFSTCRTKFGNALNFRGFPHLPGNDSGYAYVTDGGEFDGGALTP